MNENLAALWRMQNHALLAAESASAKRAYYEARFWADTALRLLVRESREDGHLADESPNWTRWLALAGQLMAIDAALESASHRA